MSPLPSIPLRNLILSALPADEFAALEPGLERIELPQHQVLFDRNRPIEYVYFVESGMISLTTHTAEAVVEIGITGREGMAGIPVLLHAERSPHRAVVQISGDGFRLRAEDLPRVVERSPALHRLLLRYTQAMLVITAQGSACNARHTLPERLARWLAMAHDRLDSDTVPLTHEFLAQMLGVRRAGVTTAVGALEMAGIITQGRGSIVVRDRAKLELASCECYGIIRGEQDRLLG